MTVWHEEDSFWETMPMFSQDSWDRAHSEVDSVLALLEIEPPAAVLDLCCGVGRHSLELARRGFRVTGVDRTASYLKSARAMAKAEGLAVDFVQADMRDFTRPASFEAAINLFTSFGYFEDQEQDLQVLINVCQSLRHGGRLILEMMGKEILARIFLPRDWQELPDGSFFLQERTISQAWSWMENRWILIKDGQTSEHKISHRIYDGTGLQALLIKAGFESIALYGGLSGAPYDQEARRLVAVAQKPVH